MRITDSRPYMIELEYSDEYYELEERHFGLCLACGEEADCCEPDAKNYLCETCGKRTVMGILYLLMTSKFIFP